MNKKRKKTKWIFWVTFIAAKFPTFSFLKFFLFMWQDFSHIFLKFSHSVIVQTLSYPVFLFLFTATNHQALLRKKFRKKKQNQTMDEWIVHIINIFTNLLEQNLYYECWIIMHECMCIFDCLKCQQTIIEIKVDIIIRRRRCWEYIF